MNVKKRNIEVIESFRTIRGGFTKKDLKKLGIDWPPQKGWRKKLVNGPLIVLK